MEEREFVDGGREAWERLAGAVVTARATGVSKMSATSLRHMHEDYRRAAADLAYAQTHFSGTPTQSYLNRLVAQAHGELYGAAPRRLAAVWRFLARDYPRLLRREWRPIALAGGLLAGAAVFGYIAAHVDYSLARLFLPAQIRDGVTDGFEARQRSNADMAGSLGPLMGAYIGVNNIQVAIMAFAGGMTFGLLTVYAMLMNGALLGALAGVFAKAGLSAGFWALIVPHGSLELPAIAIAGAAGLRLAGALVFPGDLPRAAALKAAAPVAVRLFLGTLPLFIIAAGVEGFFTPSGLPVEVKLAAGAGMFALLVGYVLLPGREA
ncbi:MAG: stage II sporulation protein M [Coriobacteriia bacterium]|nr:stage II sporulation protein M [Coriobacteriia bacterium]